jgi:hypothetical protein
VCALHTSPRPHIPTFILPLPHSCANHSCHAAPLPQTVTTARAPSPAPCPGLAQLQRPWRRAGRRWLQAWSCLTRTVGAVMRTKVGRLQCCPGLCCDAGSRSKRAWPCNNVAGSAAITLTLAQWQHAECLAHCASLRCCIRLPCRTAQSEAVTNAPHTINQITHLMCFMQ